MLLRGRDVSTVLDVGANDGGFGRSLRRHGFPGRMISFEPLSEPHARLLEAAKRDVSWETHMIALGAGTDRATMNVAGNNQASSSLLAMRPRHAQEAPDSAYVGVEDVEIRSLDSLTEKLGLHPRDRIFLKVDVQGYEAEVLAGAAQLLSRTELVGIQLEISFVDLYEGSMSWKESIAFGTNLGFTIMGMNPGFVSPTGQLLQADVVMFR